ncbi:MAG: hypothetical protein ACKVS9_04635 [Phycisphaerae bacterium]
MTLRPLRERRTWTVLALIGTFGFLIVLLMATNMELATGRAKNGWKWASLGLAITAGLSMVRMYDWPVEIRRPLLFTMLECASWLVLLYVGKWLLLGSIVVTLWYRTTPSGVPLVSAEQLPLAVGLGVVFVIATIGSVLLQRYAHRQLRIAMGRCQRCQYRLFGLTTRRCPECGTPFDPSRISHIDPGAL